MTLTEKYRPKTWEDMIGGNAKKLARIFANKKADPTFTRDAVMFYENAEVETGGLGKTTSALVIARLFAPECGCKTIAHELHCNIHVIDIGGQDQKGIEWVEHWKESFYGGRGLFEKPGWRVWIWDEAHNFSQAAQQALLKPLENIPDYNIIIATATKTDAFGAPFLSRFKSYPLSPPTTDELADYLIKIAALEGATLPDAKAVKIAAGARGNVRAALNDCESWLDLTK